MHFRVAKTWLWLVLPTVEEKPSLQKYIFEQFWPKYIKTALVVPLERFFFKKKYLGLPLSNAFSASDIKKGNTICLGFIRIWLVYQSLDAARKTLTM